MYIFDLFDDEDLLKDFLDYIVPKMKEKNIEFTNITPFSGTELTAGVRIQIVFSTKTWDFYIGGFQGNCAWLIVSNLPYDKELGNAVKTVSIEIAKYFDYPGILVSHVKDIKNLNVWRDKNSTTIIEDFNPHSGNVVECIYYKINHK
jgi:hypothetical protein